MSQTSNRTRFLYKRFISAKYSGLIETGNYDIYQSEDNIELFYVLLNMQGGLYKNNKYIIEIKTAYGSRTNFYQYPLNPPKVRFITPIYHTNISSKGTVCVDFLTSTDKWLPTYSIDTIISAIILLFETPNPSSPYNSEAGVLYSKCEKKYKLESKNIETKGINDGEGNILEDLRNQCFAPYIEKVNKRINNLDAYASYFPQLISGQVNESVKNSVIFQMKKINNTKKDKKKRVNKFRKRFNDSKSNNN